jgi:hypothetical protein
MELPAVLAQRFPEVGGRLGAERVDIVGARGKDGRRRPRHDRGLETRGELRCDAGCPALLF